MEGIYSTAPSGQGGSHSEQPESVLHKKEEDTQLVTQGLQDDKIERLEHCHLGGVTESQQRKGEDEQYNQQVKDQNQSNPVGQGPRQKCGDLKGKDNQQNKEQVHLHKNTQNQQGKGKKQKTGVIGENHQRMNYLLQVSHWLCQKEDKMARSAGSLAMSIGRKCLIRMDPLLKRSLCKGCGVVLTYGVNATVRHRKRRQKHLVITCLKCRTIKRFVNNPKHRLWTLCNEALLE